jgi:glutathione S-transferase
MVAAMSAGAGDIRLFSFRQAPSPLKVRLALAELGVEYDLIEVDLFKGEQSHPRFAAINPFQRVPVMQWGDLTLWESAAIITYLGRRFQGYWPASSEGEALAQQWMTFEAAHVARQSYLLWWTDHVAPATRLKGASPGRIKSVLRELEPALRVIEHRLQRNEYILGSAFSLVDSVFAVTLSLLQGTRGEVKLPGICAFVERIRARPSWAVGEGDALQEFRQRAR